MYDIMQLPSVMQKKGATVGQMMKMLKTFVMLDCALSWCFTFLGGLMSGWTMWLRSSWTLSSNQRRNSWASCWELPLN